MSADPSKFNFTYEQWLETFFPATCRSVPSDSTRVALTTECFEGFLRNMEDLVARPLFENMDPYSWDRCSVCPRLGVVGNDDGSLWCMWHHPSSESIRRCFETDGAECDHDFRRERDTVPVKPDDLVVTVG